MTPQPHNPDLIAALEAARTEDNMSQSKLAKLLDVTSGPLNKYLNGKYEGNVAEIERKVEDYLATRLNTKRLKTEIFKSSVLTKVFSAINLARITGDKESNISIICGPAGAGKSTAAAAYCSENPLAILATLTDQHRDGRGVANAIMSALGNPRSKGRSSVWNRLVDKLSGSKRPILIDNAQRLNGSGRAWVFDFQDQTKCPVILIGNPEILDAIKENDQQLSRFGFAEKVELESSEISNLAVKVAAQYFDDASDIRDLIAIVGKNQGGLRSVKKQALLAQALKDNGISDGRKAFQAAHSKLIRDYTLPA